MSFGLTPGTIKVFVQACLLAFIAVFFAFGAAKLHSVFITLCALLNAELRFARASKVDDFCH